MKRNRPSKPYWEMTTEELAEATKEFDKEIPPSKLRPLSQKEREWLKRAKKTGFQSIRLKKGTRLVTVTMPDELLKRSDEYAKRHRMSRSELIVRSLRSSLAFSER